MNKILKLFLIVITFFYFLIASSLLDKINFNTIFIIKND